MKRRCGVCKRRNPSTMTVCRTCQVNLKRMASIEEVTFAQAMKRRAWIRGDGIENHR